MVLLAGLGNDVSPTLAASTSGVPHLSHTNSILQLIASVFILIFILVAAFYTTKFISRLSLGKLKNSNFKVIDTYRISPNKFVQIVKIGNKFIVIAIGKDTINYITELDEAEVLIREENVKVDLSFKQILEKMKNKEN